MTLYEKIKDLLCQIEELKPNPDPDKKLPQNSFYLNENDILCCEREKGESRYPYDADGLVVWAKSSGYIDACESTFSIFKTVNFAEDPSIGFFAGIIGGMGMGGGTLLIPILTIFLSFEQKNAQAINLLVFIPMAIVALIIHFKNLKVNRISTE